MADDNEEDGALAGLEQSDDAQPGVTIADTAVVPAAPRGKPIAEVSVRIIPDEVNVSLYPRPVGPSPERLRPLWHAVYPKTGALVSVTSTDDRVRLVRLVVRGDSAQWRKGWYRWVLVVRHPPDLQGGDAIAAQDVLSENDTVLTLLLLPGERREVTLEFDAELDRETYPGDYSFQVAAIDVEDGAEDTAAALLRFRHPASRLLDHLPAIYGEAVDREAASPFTYEDTQFFSRYLRGFDDAIDPIRETLDHFYQYFGAMTTPPDFLSWLATWVSLTLDENWPELKRRRLIQEAVELYRWRGTRYGLSRYLEIYTDVVPEINDKPFAGMRLGAGTLLGRDTMLGDVPAHTFVVTIAVPNTTAVNERTVRDIIEAEKPAHTAYALRIVRRATGEEARS